MVLYCIYQQCNFTISTAHRALEDVKAMRQIFTTDTMNPVLSQLTIRNSRQITDQWQAKRNEWVAAQQFVVHFGRDCSKTMAIRLKEWNITYDELKSFFSEYNTSEAFDDQLRQRGIHRKAWRNKIWLHFSGQKTA